MTIDERLAEYMKGWHIGTMPAEMGAGMVEHYKPKGMWTEDMDRGYTAGCAERELTERRQREWLQVISAPPIDDDEVDLLTRNLHIQAIGHYARRTNVNLSFAAKIIGQWR